MPDFKVVIPPALLQHGCRQTAAGHRRQADGDTRRGTGRTERRSKSSSRPITSLSSRCAGTRLHACMTRVDHTSGTDRIAEVAAQQGWRTTPLW